MSLLQMTVSAGLLIIAIAIVRAVALNCLPKKMFLVLWGIVLIRLFVPFSIPLPIGVPNVFLSIDYAITTALPSASIPQAAQNPVNRSNINTEAVSVQHFAQTPQTQYFAQQDQVQYAVQSSGGLMLNIPPATIIWLAGLVAFLIFFAVIYFKNNKVLKDATIIRDNVIINQWLAKSKLMRPIIIMQSDRIKSPLAVGIIRPRIILPKSIELSDKQTLNCVLTHEHYHIRRFDALWKQLMLIALCVHWFNPLVWVMFVLASRDLELTCDEVVINRYGEKTKKTYAYMLINMAQQDGALAPLYSGFSKNATEERIISIMRMKKSSIISIIIAFMLVSTLTVGALGMFSAPGYYEAEAVNEHPMLPVNTVEETTRPYYYAQNSGETSTDEANNLSETSATTGYAPISQSKMDIRIELFAQEYEWADNEVGGYLSVLHAYLEGLVLQGDIQNHVLDITCELSHGSELSVRINQSFEATGNGWTGYTREIDGVIQRELIKPRNAYIFCPVCNVMPDTAMVTVIWNEIWWENAPQEWLDLFSEQFIVCDRPAMGSGYGSSRHESQYPIVVYRAPRFYPAVIGYGNQGMGRGNQGMGRGGQGMGQGAPDAPCHPYGNRQRARHECRALLG